MKMGHLRRMRPKRLLLALSMALLGAYVCIGLLQARQLGRIDEALQGGNFNPLYADLQLQIEYFRLQQAVDRYRYDPGGFSLGELKLRYELFLSRFSVVDTETSRRLMGMEQAYKDAVNALVKFGDATEAFPLRANEPAAIRVLNTELNRLNEPIQALIQATTQAMAAQVDQGQLQMRNHAYLTSLLTILQAGLTLALVFLIVRLYEYRRLAQATAMLSQQRLVEALKHNESQLELQVAERTAMLEEAMAEIQKLAMADVLTGAFNRRYLQDHLPLELARVQRLKRPLAVIAFDIDHFKHVNDTYGHPAGDEVLRSVVACCMSELRQGIDWMARQGGEEFVIILPEATQAMALRVAERLRALIESCTVFPQQGSLSVTCSFGVTSIADDDDADSLLARVDQQMYRAKQEGRNRVAGD